LLRWLDRRLPKPPDDPTAELTRDDKLMQWELENRLPVNQGRPRAGGQGGFR
jgi:hypothetical protein